MLWLTKYVEFPSLIYIDMREFWSTVSIVPALPSLLESPEFKCSNIEQHRDVGFGCWLYGICFSPLCFMNTGLSFCYLVVITGCWIQDQRALRWAQSHWEFVTKHELVIHEMNWCWISRGRQLVRWYFYKLSR